MPEKRSRLQTHGNGSEKMDHRFCSHRPPRARGRPPCAGASRSAWPAANEMIQPVFRCTCTPSFWSCNPVLSTTCHLLRGKDGVEPHGKAVDEGSGTPTSKGGVFQLTSVRHCRGIGLRGPQEQAQKQAREQERQEERGERGEAGLWLERSFYCRRIFLPLPTCCRA